MSIRLLAGDCRSVLGDLPDASVHCCVTDPPYHLTSIVKRFGAPDAAPAQFGTDGAFARASRGFMGKQWDGGDVAFQPDTWREVLRVLKPGGHLVAFGGTRTSHRMACAIEDAGFEIRDTLCWLYGSGFPKSHNLHGDWQGWGTALKPAHEPIILARKPLQGTVAANVLAHGTGAINVDACRVVAPDAPEECGISPNAKRRFVGVLNGGRASAIEPRTNTTSQLGRWPANVLHDGSDEVEAAFAAFGRDDRIDSRGAKASVASLGYHGGTNGHDATPVYADTGSASRFFYSAKATAADRADSRHPTVKPIDLMRWLVRLVCPPGGTVLDPFAGSGTTGEAAMLCGFDAVLIEQDAQHVADIRHRMNRWSGHDAPLFASPPPAEDPEEARSRDLFSEIER